MGTRADFYIGRGPEAEWLGSIAYDGYPTGIAKDVLSASTPNEYRSALWAFFRDRDDVSSPDHGWPWPWNDSGTTDYAYALDDGKVWASSFGHQWFDPQLEEPDDDDEPRGEKAVFPDMSAVKNVAWDKRSGFLVMRTPQ